MAMSQRSTLYYEGYDPTWIIGTGNPAPVHPPQTISINRPVEAICPKVPAQANGLVPQEQVHHVQPYQQGPGKGKQKPEPQSHGGKGAHHGQSHAQTIGKSNLRPEPMAQSHFAGTANHKSAPHPQRVVGSNPNPYLQTIVVQDSLPAAVHLAVPVPVIHAQGPVVNAPVPLAPGVRAKRPAHVTTLQDILVVNPVFKVAMWVPLCCEACEKNWKDKLTDLPGFQGCDVERKLDRVIVFGRVDPSSVLKTIQKVVPRAEMWKH